MAEMELTNHARDDADKFYLIGAGIASLASAAFLIRDGKVEGKNIIILEESNNLGGSLDAAGNPSDGYTMRGGRMFESKYVCTFDLFASIPTLDESTTVTEEILHWNQVMKTSSEARLFRDGRRVTAPEFGLDEDEILTLEKLLMEPEGMLGRSSIADQFEPAFFETNFWLMWCTTFAFQPWHSAVEFKRYLLRFTHMVPGFNTLKGIMRTVYNQHDSLVRPLLKWLESRGVRFELDTRVTDLVFSSGKDQRVKRIFFERDGHFAAYGVREADMVFVTLGSMTEASSVGSMHSAPERKDKRSGGAWTLWEKIADGRPHFGVPANFSEHIDESKWVSFTTTLHDPTFFDLVRDATGNVPGEGGLTSFPNSSWLASIVLPHQPHFIGQPSDVQVFWGYGLSVDNPGRFVNKAMSACSGSEIMTEILGHLGFGASAEKIMQSCTCIPCMMPFITSQFLRRSKGDRPDVIPPRTQNFAFIGQFCELKDDVVFTVEYSIRSAQEAVYKLLRLDRTPPPIYKGQHDPTVLLDALKALHGVHA